MIYVALALAGVLSITVVAFAGLLRSVLRSQARERDLLLNQLMHLSGRTWSPPPVGLPAVEPVDDGRYVLTPEQEPGL